MIENQSKLISKNNEEICNTSKLTIIKKRVAIFSDVSLNTFLEGGKKEHWRMDNIQQNTLLKLISYMPVFEND